MTTKTKTTKTPTLLERVQERHDVRAAIVDTRQAELDAVRKRNVEHTVKRDSGALDYDALEHLQDEHTEAAHVRFLEAQAPHLEVERQAVDSFRIAESVGDLGAQRDAFPDLKAGAVEKIRKALEEYASAVEAYNTELAGLIGDARKAGLIEGESDPSLPIISAGGTHGHPRALLVNGERYTALRADLEALVREARK